MRHMLPCGYLICHSFLNEILLLKNEAREMKRTERDAILDLVYSKCPTNL